MKFDLQILVVSECDVISSEPCAFVGPISRVHGVCHVPGFGFWGVTGVMHGGDSNPASSEDDDDVALKDSQAVGKSTMQERTAICSQERHEEGCSIDAVGDSLTPPKNSNDYKNLNGEDGKQVVDGTKQPSEHSSSSPGWTIEKNNGPILVAQQNSTNLQEFNNIGPDVNVNYDGLSKSTPGCSKSIPKQSTAVVSSLNSLANLENNSKSKADLEQRMEEDSERTSRDARKKQRKKKKSKKIRSCQAVYKDSNPEMAIGVQKMGRGRSSLLKELGEKVPEFYPKDTNSVAGASITDSTIENCKRGFHNKDRVTSALDAWNLIKDMGFAADGNEDEIIKKIELIEQRDINAKKQALESNTVNGGEVRIFHP
ncbi:hypothetical protein SLEP1_g14739 [Rubroshorea leprosula]|uniref:Uncharacterized protein n=1 Tax=Rubroshorea leprosula TaxID=152421 RepID=A0AAV5IK52_9ROSI|nr:hypothetical protein SLEP1_g14739 [Rubroshorea leprosula]